jgi:hypothetical protein
MKMTNYMQSMTRTKTEENDSSIEKELQRERCGRPYMVGLSVVKEIERSNLGNRRTSTSFSSCRSNNYKMLAQPNREATKF